MAEERQPSHPTSDYLTKNGFEKLLAVVEKLRDEMDDMKRKDKEKEEKIEGLEKLKKDKEILLKRHEEEKSARDALEKFHSGTYYREETWEPEFKTIKETAIRRLEEFMHLMQTPEEDIQTNNDHLERSLNDCNELIRTRQGQIKTSTMTQLKNMMTGDFWVLRVEEKLGKARAKIMTAELYKDDDIKRLVQDLEKKCKRRRWGIILGVSSASGFVTGHAVGIGLGVAGVCAACPAALIGLGAGVLVGLICVGGMFLYSHWPEIKEYSAEKLSKIFPKKSEFGSTEEVLEAINEARVINRPQA